MEDVKSILRKDAEKIYTVAISACMPCSAVEGAMKDFSLPKGRLILVAVGKAACKMAKRASEIIEDGLGGKIDAGAVITKYGHTEGKIGSLEIYEAAHPVPDINGIAATERVLSLTENLSGEDCVLFLVSGGGSALFESPLCSFEELTYVTERLLASGADINEINTVRKHLSKVKGGRFAEHIYPARFFTVALSDVIGNRLDTIASGPTAPDASTSEEVRQVLKRYQIEVSDSCYQAIMSETPKSISNGEHRIGGSVTELCRHALDICRALGYEAEIITDCEQGIAREVGKGLAGLAVQKSRTDKNLAFIIGGESVVKICGRVHKVLLTFSISDFCLRDFRFGL